VSTLFGNVVVVVVDDDEQSLNWDDGIIFNKTLLILLRQHPGQQ
jgi:hypothetical protein